MSSRSVILFALMLSIGAFSGCFSWGHGANYLGALSAQEALYAVDDALDLLSSGEQLVYIAGNHEEDDHPSFAALNGELNRWSFGFYNPATDSLREVRVDREGGIHQRQAQEWKGLRYTFHPISPALGIDSPAALDAALDFLNDTVNLDDPEGVSYWLQSNGVTDVWRIILRPLDADPEVVQLDAATGAILTTGLPPIELTFHDAQALINATLGILPPAGPIQPPIPPDEYLFLVTAMETEDGGFRMTGTLGHFSTDTIIPPDFNFNDGKAPVWAFFVWDSSAHETFVALAYADGAVVESEHTKPQWIRRGYEESIITGNPLDSTDIFQDKFGGDENDRQYDLYMNGAEEHLLWELQFYDGDTGGGWVFDAETGEHLY